MKTLHPNFENVLSEFKYALDVISNFLLGTFYSIGKFSKKRYIRYKLYPEFVIPVCVKPGMGCVFVTGDSSTLFTAYKNSEKHYIRYTLQHIKLIKCHFFGLNKTPADQEDIFRPNCSSNDIFLRLKSSNYTMKTLRGLMEKDLTLFE